MNETLMDISWETTFIHTLIQGERYGVKNFNESESHSTP